MRKSLLKLFKHINHFNNEKMMPKSEATSLLNILLLKSDPAHCIEVFEELEIMFKKEMQKREKEAARVCRMINCKYPIEASINEKYPASYFPLNENVNNMDVVFEIVNAK